jgi:ABC-type nitrate/sulfonate/bicarbonate transport system permease component
MNDILAHSLSSLGRVGLGVFLGTIFGIFLAVLRSIFPLKLRRNFLVSLFFEFPRFPPPIAWIPFVILLFGIGQLSTIVIVFIASFPVMYANTYEWIERIPAIYVRISKTMELSVWKKIFSIYLPAISPGLFTGFRQALGMGWMSIIAAEMIGGQEGLGYSIQLSRLNLEYGEMIVHIFIIGFLGFCFHFGSLWLEEKKIPWSKLRAE